jgi:hypothetical protein
VQGLQALAEQRIREAIERGELDNQQRRIERTASSA